MCQVSTSYCKNSWFERLLQILECETSFFIKDIKASCLPCRWARTILTSLPSHLVHVLKLCQVWSSSLSYRSISRLLEIRTSKSVQKVTPICDIWWFCDSAIEGLDNSWSFSVPTYLSPKCVPSFRKNPKSRTWFRLPVTVKSRNIQSSRRVKIQSSIVSRPSSRFLNPR